MSYLIGKTMARPVQVQSGDIPVFDNSGNVQSLSPTETYVETKPSPNSPGIRGQRYYDGVFIYECVAENMWRRYSAEAEWDD
tara:strand:- start:235 stop:480 length:246 start_codon:yes stop_codon:yes gene_type:complete